MSVISKKVCLVGDFSVGKTSLIRRFVDRQFSDKYLSTVGVKISRKTLELKGVKQQESLSLQLLIWDLEGRTQFKPIAPSYMQGAKGAVVVADVSRQETLEQISNHIDLFLSVNPQGLIIIALNKSDLIDEGKMEKLVEFFQSKELKQVLAIYPTSAKTGKDVDEMFHTLAYRMMEPE